MIPIFILMLDSETGNAGWLRSAAAILGVPGAFVGFLLAFGRIHDVDPWITDIANFAFYFIGTWLVLRVLNGKRASKLSGSRQ